MVPPPGRRERKKAATRKAIADAALRLFLERGYAEVGVREVANEADVATATLFAYFPSKEALVFDCEEAEESALVEAVTGRAPGVSIPEALHRKFQADLRDAAGLPEFRRLISETPALREYADRMWLRYEKTLAAAIAAELGYSDPPPACRALARFVLDARVLVREEADPVAATEQIFALISSGWDRMSTALT
ncbi:TetR/AcrR family transcriptional regulator [Amycolatopsis jejuensis]|uniref:TetR/AcrR family transcriptional regulator n=1 Tax=Amycolatopsis jejuensis TaxID=330084 RepID=UPI000A99811F|nr:TetR/AcrR family transcriptional regulator [Amycolatopsis jejuensis]